ncbi:MAG: DUF2059 domain-containing protein [Flavobacteriales bacterium]|nr:DUF2059 domain-containing protein [Flavobacteriales bacterium]MCA0390175.1 DUF2059 domain-containing protein [Bacteroidota bacterium]
MKTALQILLFLFPLNFYTQSKEQKVEFLIDELGYFNSIKSKIFDYHIENLKNYGDKNDNRIKTLENKINDKEILKRLVNAYSKTYSENEINEIYKFYNSETGKKFAKSNNLVEENIKDNFVDVFEEIKRLQEENQQKKSHQASYLTNFFESKYEKQDGFYLVTENKIDREESNLELETNPLFTLKDIEEIESIYNDQGNLVIDIKFKNESAKKLKEITANNINKGMAIIVDKKIIIMPVIASEIPDGKLQISGPLSVEEMKNIVNKLKK